MRRQRTVPICLWNSSQKTTYTINTNTKKVDKATANDDNTPRDTQGEPVKTQTPTKVRVYNPSTGKWEVK